MIVRVLFLLLLLASPALGEVVESTGQRFTLQQRVELPVPPEEAYDAMTGDISGWWDHHFSERPAEFYIEPRPGGGFYEIFDESGDGVLHATVIAAQRGRLLRLDGALGLAGTAIQMVHTLAFEAAEGGCAVTLTVSAAGIVKEGWAEAVDGVWKHFLVEQLEPWVRAGHHLERPEGGR